MEIRTRNRVMGGVFFIALAVIFIPMLFDEPRGPALEIEPMPKLVIDPVPDIPLPNAGTAIAKRNELREHIDDEGFLVESGTRLGDVTLDVDAIESDVWAVQLGSFRDEARANTLRERLMNDGQSTWVSQAKINDELMTRVAVGPFQEKLDAEAFRVKATEKYEVEALVVGFKP